MSDTPTTSLVHVDTLLGRCLDKSAPKCLARSRPSVIERSANFVTSPVAMTEGPGEDSVWEYVPFMPTCRLYSRSRLLARILRPRACIVPSWPYKSKDRRLAPVVSGTKGGTPSGEGTRMGGFRFSAYPYSSWPVALTELGRQSRLADARPRTRYVRSLASPSHHPRFGLTITTTDDGKFVLARTGTRHDLG